MPASFTFGEEGSPLPPAPASPDLLAAAQAGDTVALNELVRAVAPSVVAWCTRLGGPGVVAEDAAQDVLVVLFTRLSSVPGAAGLRPWLWGVTRRVLSDHRKRAWVRRWVPGIFLDRPDPAAGPDHRHGLSEQARLVERLLDEMPVAQREVFVLCDIEGETDTAAADLLGLPLGTVKSRLRLARARFKAPAPLAASRHPRNAVEAP